LKILIPTQIPNLLLSFRHKYVNFSAGIRLDWLRKTILELVQGLFQMQLIALPAEIAAFLFGLHVGNT
jgi:hypothetical protein